MSVASCMHPSIAAASEIGSSLLVDGVDINNQSGVTFQGHRLHAITTCGSYRPLSLTPTRSKSRQTLGSRETRGSVNWGCVCGSDRPALLCSARRWQSAMRSIRTPSSLYTVSFDQQLRVSSSWQLLPRSQSADGSPIQRRPGFICSGSGQENSIQENSIQEGTNHNSTSEREGFPTSTDEAGVDREGSPTGTDTVEQGTFEEVAVALEKVGRNTRRIQASVDVCAPPYVVWGVLTDYGSLADIIPGLVVNEVLERRPRGAKLLQVGEQDVAFGAKFSARIVMNVEEVPEETLEEGTREIEFQQLEGDFRKFDGVWRMEQIELPHDPRIGGQSIDGEVQGTRLSYIAEVSPQMWMPVRLIEGRIAKEIGTNMRSIKIEALKRFCHLPPSVLASL